MRLAMSVHASTLPLALRLMTDLAKLGHAATAFPADGTGGKALEKGVSAGAFDGVIETCLRELADHSAGPDRLTAAALAGVPQIILPGGLDATANGALTLPEVERVAVEVVNKACASRASVVIVCPEFGFSTSDRPGEPYCDPERARVFRQVVKLWLAPPVRWAEVSGHLLDDVMAEAVLREVAQWDRN